MRLFSILTGIFCTAALVARAQTFSVSGRILDENNTAIPYANAALFSATDSSLAGGGVSDDSGVFTISAKPGQYYLRITFLSYEEEIISNVDLKKSNQDVGAIRLRVGSKVLETVTVQGEKSQMELYLDKRVFHVGKDLSNI